MAVLLISAIGLWPLTASAQTQTDPAFGQPITIQDASASFTKAGYQVEPALNWGWLQPTVSTFAVHDPASDRQLMVFVFPNAQAAGVFRGRIAAHFQSEAPDPHVLGGYGPSAWVSNVGMVESTGSQLGRVAELQAEQDDGVYVDPGVVLDALTPDTPVDVDFQEALRTSIVNL
jgi:hypothetical protein